MTNTTFKIRSILSSLTLRKRHLGYKHSTSKAGLWHRNFVSMPISPSLSYRIRKFKKLDTLRRKGKRKYKSSFFKKDYTYHKCYSMKSLSGERAIVLFVLVSNPWTIFAFIKRGLGVQDILLDFFLKNLNKTIQKNRQPPKKVKKIIHKILLKKGFKPYEAINYSEY